MTAVAAKQQVGLFRIGTDMHAAGLPDSFVASAIRTAMEFDGVRELVQLWSDEDTEAERAEIVADIQDMIDDCQQEVGRTDIAQLNKFSAIEDRSTLPASEVHTKSLRQGAKSRPK